MQLSAQSAKLPAAVESFIRNGSVWSADSLLCFSSLPDGGSGEKRGAHRSKEDEQGRRAAQVSHKHQENHRDESHQQWTKRGKQEAPHHSKEVSAEEEMEERRSQTSPEQKELQMIARKRGSEEEGSASRKSEVCPFLLPPARKRLHFTICC